MTTKCGMEVYQTEKPYKIMTETPRLFAVKDVGDRVGMKLPGIQPNLIKDRQTRVFGIGLSRTGTTSLTEALRILGWEANHWSRTGDLDEMLSAPAATDINIACRWKFLAHLFPDAYFILTVRDINEWQESMERHLARYRDMATRLWGKECMFRCYGSCEPTSQELEDAYFNHYHEVTGRALEDDSFKLLEMNICAGDGWETLCPFLGVPEPDVPFPWENRRQP